MANSKGRRIELGGDAELTHSPFASLKGTVEGTAGVPPAAPDPPPEAGAAPSGSGRIEVRRERKGRGGKTVTLVSWLAGAPDQGALAALARQLASALGAGARVEDGGAITVQGDQVERTIEALVARGRTETIIRGTQTDRGGGAR